MPSKDKKPKAPSTNQLIDTFEKLLEDAIIDQDWHYKEVTTFAQKNFANIITDLRTQTSHLESLVNTVCLQNESLEKDNKILQDMLDKLMK